MFRKMTNLLHLRLGGVNIGPALEVLDFHDRGKHRTAGKVESNHSCMHRHTPWTDRSQTAIVDSPIYPSLAQATPETVTRPEEEG